MTGRGPAIVGTEGGRVLSWSGKVGLIAGCTSAIDSHHAVIASMGERFLMYRLPPIEAEAYARRAYHVGRERTMARGARQGGTTGARRHVRRATERLVQLATLAVRCRSAVERDGYTRELQLVPEPEAPGRLATAPLRLLNGLLAIGASVRESCALVMECVLDSMPVLRRTVLEELLRRGVAASTTEVAESVRYPTTTTRRTLEDLAAHGLAERAAQGQGRADLWQATGWVADRWPVPETSDGTGERTFPETSGAPISLPLRMNDDISGKVGGHTW